MRPPTSPGGRAPLRARSTIVTSSSISNGLRMTPAKPASLTCSCVKRWALKSNTGQPAALVRYEMPSKLGPRGPAWVSAMTRLNLVCPSNSRAISWLVARTTEKPAPIKTVSVKRATAGSSSTRRISRGAVLLLLTTADPRCLDVAGVQPLPEPVPTKATRGRLIDEHAMKALLAGTEQQRAVADVAEGELHLRTVHAHAVDVG